MLKARLLVSVVAVLALSSLSCRSPSEPSEEVDPQAGLTGDRIATSQGNLVVHPINHATFFMNWSGRTLYFDPVGDSAAYQGLPPPDVIFVTDIHSDHLSAQTLKALIQSGTVIVAPQAVQAQLPADLQALTRVLANGETTTVVDIPVQALPMYNLTPERLQYHTKGRGNGYLLTLGNQRVYVAGDTEDIPEMRALSGIGVAFIPMNLPYTMTVNQAADAVRAFKPAIVYPYHSRGSDLAEFTRLVGTDAGVEVRVRNWY